MRLLLLVMLSACAAHTTSPRTEPARPQRIALPSGGNGVYWDTASETLYIAGGNSLLAWREGSAVTTVATPSPTGKLGLGGVVARPDHSLLVASFGSGNDGTIWSITAGSATALTGLDPARRRIGLAIDRKGTVYSAYFTGHHGEQHGGIAEIAIDGNAAHETDLAGDDALQKVVGVVATDDTLFLSDQSQKAIFALSLADHALRRLATVPAADLLAVLPNGDLLTGGGSTISRVTQAGDVSQLAIGALDQVRGIAVDAAHDRLFVVDHAKAGDALVVLALPH